MSRDRSEWPGRAEYLRERRRMRAILWTLTIASHALAVAVVLFW